MRKTIMISLLCLNFTGILMAYNTFVGFSGAPASNGTCTSSCHGQNAFDPECEVIGFPETYNPGQHYLISVHVLNGPAINQFNCSIRSDEDSSVAGEISAGFATEVYNTTNESTGVHWEASLTDSGAFVWTAPETATGPVTLYWAGLQGTRGDGADQQIVIHANEVNNSIDYIADLPESFTLDQNYPNPFNNSTSIPLQVSQPGDIALEIANILGQRVYMFTISDAQPGRYMVHWDGSNAEHRQLPSGMYFYQLRTIEGNVTRKMTLLR